MSSSGFALISTPVDVAIELPVEIVPGVRLKRAADYQVDRIRSWFPQNQYSPTAVRFECERISTDNSGAYTLEELPRDKWKYLVIEFEGQNRNLRPVYEMLSAAECDLRFDVIFLEAVGRTQYGVMTYPEDAWQRELYLPPPKRLDDAAMADIRECVECRIRLDGVKHEGIGRALGLYSKVSARDFTEFKVVEYFAVLEMLLTHQPGDREVGDSIRHQLQTKIPLLEARMPSPISYLSFDELPARKVWDLLYSFRSAVAHGGHVDLGKSLKLLGSQANALGFLQEATRKLLRQAMREPDLVTNLKAV